MIAVRRREFFSALHNTPHRIDSPQVFHLFECLALPVKFKDGFHSQFFGDASLEQILECVVEKIQEGATSPQRTPFGAIPTAKLVLIWSPIGMNTQFCRSFWVRLSISFGVED